jgi:three-Cys-motif partner protein
MAKRGTDYEALAARVRFGFPDGLATRGVRRWTLDKLAILAYYLPSFAAICQKQAQGWYYIDGFAGSGVNVVSGEGWYKGSAILGMSTEPSAAAALLIERDGGQADALRQRAAEFRSPATVIQGDANVELPTALAGTFTNRHLPALCVLDPEGLELRWETIEAVARHRLRQYAPYELVIYFSTPGVARISGRTGASEAYRDTLRRLFGQANQQWEDIAGEHMAGNLPPGHAGREYRALYREQVRTLGYSTVIDRPVESSDGTLIYHLIMATNNDVGAEILTRASEVAFLNNLPFPRLD